MLVDRNEAFQRLVAKALSLPEGGFRTSISMLSEIYRPLDAPSTARRVTVGSVRECLKDRAWVFGGSDDREVRDCRGTRLFSPEKIIYDLSGSYVFANGNVLCENILAAVEFRSGSDDWRDTGWWGLPLELIGFHDFDPNDNSAILFNSNLENARKLADENGYFLFNSMFSEANIGHFFHDTLVQVSAYQRACERSGTRLTPLLTSVHGAAQPFRFPMLNFLFERLVGPLDKVAFVNAGVAHVEKCYASHRCLQDAFNGRVDHEAFRNLHGKLLEIPHTHATADTPHPEKIYLSRSDVNRADRKFDNIDELERLLEGNGFVTIVPTQWTPEETLNLFSNARMIVGVHGAGLMNIMLAPAGTKVIEITEVPDSWMSIASVSAAVGHDHHRVHSYADTDTGRAMINIEDVRGLL